MLSYEPISLEEAKAAQKRIEEDIVRTPLVKLNHVLEDTEIFLKLENLQPVRSFKIRAASNAIKQIEPKLLKKGVYTISAGNWAQGLAYMANKLGIKCTIITPDTIPEVKEKAIQNYNAKVIKLPLSDGLPILFTRNYPGLDGHFIHPFSDIDVITGSTTIGLEIQEDLPDFDTILVPWGGGGLACGIASVVRLIKPEAKVFAVEIDHCKPLTECYKLKKIPKEFQGTNESFVDSIGYPFMLPEMFELAKKVLDGTIVVTLEDTAEAIRLLAKNNSVIVEGAGAVSVAAALSGRASVGKIVSIVSGGNIDSTKLTKILNGKIPL